MTCTELAWSAGTRWWILDGRGVRLPRHFTDDALRILD